MHFEANGRPLKGSSGEAPEPSPVAYTHPILGILRSILNQDTHLQAQRDKPFSSEPAPGLESFVLSSCPLPSEYFLPQVEILRELTRKAKPTVAKMPPKAPA